MSVHVNLWECMYAMCMQDPAQATRGSPWNQSSRWLRAVLWVQGSNLRSCAEAGSGLPRSHSSPTDPAFNAFCSSLLFTHLPFSILPFLLFVKVCFVCTCILLYIPTQVIAWMWGQRITFGCQLFPSTVSVSRTELRSAHLVASVLTYWIMLPINALSLSLFLWNSSLCRLQNVCHYISATYTNIIWFTNCRKFL